LVVSKLVVFMLKLLLLHLGDFFDSLHHVLFCLSDVFGLLLHQQDLSLQSSPALNGLQLILIVIIFILLCNLLLIVVLHLL
jgi:hypothetical protein